MKLTLEYQGRKISISEKDISPLESVNILLQILGSMGFTEKDISEYLKKQEQTQQENTLFLWDDGTVN